MLWAVASSLCVTDTNLTATASNTLGNRTHGRGPTVGRRRAPVPALWWAFRTTASNTPGNRTSGRGLMVGSRRAHVPALWWSLKRSSSKPHNASFIAAKVVGYAESSGDTFTIHSERASDMRFHMLLANKQGMEHFRMAGIKTLVYTNDADQRFTYDLVAGHVVTPGVPAVVPAPTPSATTEEESLGNAGPSDTATKAAASNIPQSAPAVAPAALAPATTTATADTTKPCVTDKSGHTVCLDQH